MASYNVNGKAEPIASVLESKSSTDFEENCLKVNDSDLNLETLKDKIQKLSDAASDLNDTEDIEVED